MSLRPQDPSVVPEGTRRVAQAAFRKGTLCMRIADALGPAYQDGQFASLFPRRGQPAEAPGRLALAAEIGADGQRLLSVIDAATGQPELAQLPKVEILRRVWTAHHANEEGRWRGRAAEEMPPAAEQVCSPYDPDARYSTKREAAWAGYKAQLTDTCDRAWEGPHVITNVETTPATTPDDNMVAVVHQSLERRGLLPGERLVDKGYTDSRVLADGPQQLGSRSWAQSPPTRAGRRASKVG